MTKYIQPELASGGFDYTAVKADIADQMRLAAARVHNLHLAAVLDVGRELLAIKNQVEHGRFVEWVERECQMSIRTAQRAMQAAEMVEKDDRLSYLPSEGLLALSSRAGKPIVGEIIGRIEAGEKPSVSQIKEQIAGAKWAVKRAAEGAGPTPPQHQERAQQRAEEERQQQQWECERAERAVAARLAAKMLAECLGGSLGDFVALHDKSDLWEISCVLRDPMQLAAIRAELSAEMATCDIVNSANNDEPPLPFMTVASQEPVQVAAS